MLEDYRNLLFFHLINFITKLKSYQVAKNEETFIIITISCSFFFWEKTLLQQFLNKINMFVLEYLPLFCVRNVDLSLTMSSMTANVYSNRNIFVRISRWIFQVDVWNLVLKISES